MGSKQNPAGLKRGVCMRVKNKRFFETRREFIYNHVAMKYPNFLNIRFVYDKKESVSVEINFLDRQQIQTAICLKPLKLFKEMLKIKI